MNNADSDKKQPAKKSNSYSLLLKGLSDVAKTKKQQNSNSSKKAHSPENRNNKTDGMPTDPDIPDRSYGDYFCKLCDSHMNSDAMWEAHITGKRHMKNVKKGDTDSKYEDLPDVESSVKYEMRNVKDPVVGLSYIHEIRRKEPNVPPIYNCFLCHASIATVPLLTEHVLTLKHRLNYIRENNPEEYELLEATNLKKGHMEPLVLDVARKMEEQYGRGTVKVKQEKKKPPVVTYSAKRAFNPDDDNSADDRYNKNPNYIKLSSDKNKLDVWRSIDTKKGFGRQERSRSPPVLRDNFTNHSRSRSPKDFKGRRRQYSDDELSLDGYKRSFPRRDLSPRRDSYEKSRSFSKRDSSPNRDFHDLRSTDTYPLSSGRNDLPNYYTIRYDNSDLRDASRYDHSSAYDKDRYEHISSYEHLKSVSSHLPEESYLPPRNREVDIPSRHKSYKDILEDISMLSSEDCYKLFYLRLKSLPDIRSIGEMVALTKLISEAQKKLKSKLSEELVSAIIKYQKSDTSSNIIPGLDDAMSSSAKSLNLTDNSPKPSSAANFINDIFKRVNYSPLGKSPAPQDKSSFPYSLPTSYASAINSQQASVSSTYQSPPGNFQAPLANSYPGSASSSFPNRAPYQSQNTNVPFSSGASNFMPDISSLNTQGPKPEPSQVFNYSHYSSSSSVPSRNFPRKY